MRVSKLSPLAVAVSLGVSALAAPTAANAEMSASFAASNMYLWRGLNVSDPAPAVSGSLDYSHDSGFYAGVWTSSEGPFDGSSEWDYYFGFGGEAGSIGWDVMYIEYVYPTSAGTDTTISEGLMDFSDIVLSLSAGDFSASFYIDTVTGDNDAFEGDEGELSIGDKIYYTLGYSYEKFDFTLGSWMMADEAGGSDAEYTHANITYNATDELSFTFFSVIDEPDAGNPFGAGWGVDGDLNIAVTWSKSFDL